MGWWPLIASWLWWLLQGYALVSLGTLIVPFIFNALFLRSQNLKRKYASSWALVTGASSGIGKAVVEKLAGQGINVVMVALPDQLLQDTHAEMEERFVDVEFRMCPCNLAVDGYMTEIIDVTADIPVNLVFNNAGFMVTGLFADIPIGKVMANYDCNATSMVKITHYFINRMTEMKLKGAICFTSSPAGLFPNPTACIYGATKAFITEFACSVAAEVRQFGIDVTVIHPSPVGSRFYDKAHDLDAINLFKKTTTTPDVIANTMFSALGRTTVRDQGYFPLMIKMVLKLLDYNFFAQIITWTAQYNADMKKVKKQQ